MHFRHILHQNLTETTRKSPYFYPNYTLNDYHISFILLNILKYEFGQTNTLFSTIKMIISSIITQKFQAKNLKRNNKIYPLTSLEAQN